ncbi:CUB domain-containing protein 1-like [Polyodon spathula]|uniref:CUB domain-containing protein 1-like n=1 Tax=Polyodon spathula TaxID=7913 RepID=UPI001B7E7D3D|nr:CUB domain-containing protein 1-like [Polyodon spathula]
MDRLTRICTAVLPGILLAQVIVIRECQTATLSTGENTTITIKSSFPKANCSVCVLKNKQSSCSSELRLQPRENRTYSFSCPDPYKFFTIEISKNTVCLSNLYSTEVKELLSLAFPKFNNTLIWNISFSENKALVLDFFGSGLRQIKPSESCPDQLTYSILTYLTADIQNIGTFCRRGAVSKIQVDKGARVSLQMSGKEEVDEPGFSMTIAPPIKKCCIIEVSLLPGSSVNLLSPNYPLSFSDDDLMSWMFTVPENNKAAVVFLNYTQPNCDKKSERVEYTLAGYQSTIGKSLTDQQPSFIHTNFEMQLENCKMDKSDPGKLSLEFRVEAFNESYQNHFWIDLQKEKGLNITIKHKKVNPNCQICVGAACQPEITLHSGKKTKVILKKCNLEELGMVVTKHIGCYNWEECPVKEMLLKVPSSLASLPVPLESLTWQLRAPTASTVVLNPGKAKLKHLLPGDKCKEGFYYRLLKGNDSELGRFCPQGSIEKVQINCNVSVVLIAVNNHSQILEPFFNVTFEKEIAESYIFTVSPELDVMSYLVTPNWPEGMAPLSSVSWKVLVPPGHMVQVSFLNATQPECRKSHTSISIMGQSSVEEELSRREDELLPEHQTMTEDFWLNMSNCKPDGIKKTFKVMCQVTLKKKQNDLIMKIAISTLSALLVIVAFIVIISCVMKKKKKKQIQTSIYNPNVNTFFPGHPLFSKGRRDNDSHIYADIDETMMYGQLLRERGMTPLPEVDIYRPFEGPVGDRPPTPPPLFNRGKTKEVSPEVDVYRPFLGPVGEEPPIPVLNQEASMEAVADSRLVDSRLVDSKLYTFQQHEQEAETAGNEDELPLPPADEEMEQNKVQIIAPQRMLDIQSPSKDV